MAKKKSQNKEQEEKTEENSVDYDAAPEKGNDSQEQEGSRSQYENINVDYETGEVYSEEEDEKKKELKKKFYKLSDYKAKSNIPEIKKKPQEYINMSHAFKDVTKLPGIPKGQIVMNYGKSDVGKTTMLIEAGANALEQGILPILILTENKFSWNRAERMGLYRDFCIVHDGVQTIEDGWERIREHMEDLEDGTLQETMGVDDVIFLWDSIGATPSKKELETNEENFKKMKKMREEMVKGNKVPKDDTKEGGMMVTAKVLRECFNRDLAHKINNTQREDCPYNATMLVVNHAYTKPPTPPSTVSTIVPYGGDGVYLASSLVFRMGGVNSNSSKVTATKEGTEVAFAIKSGLMVEKNHVTEVAAKGKILCTDHGFIKEENLDDYKKKYKGGWDLNFDSYWDQVSVD